MIRECPELKKFEMELIRNNQPDYFKNLAVIESLYQEAITLGVFPLKNPLDGIEVDFTIARTINHVRKSD